MELHSILTSSYPCSRQIFTQSTLGAAKQIWSTHSLYNAALLREFLSQQKSTDIPMCLVPSEASQPRVAVVATRVGDTPMPYLFRNFRIPSVSKYEGDCDTTWMDAILASTAAPGMLSHLPFSLSSLLYNINTILQDNHKIRVNLLRNHLNNLICFALN